MAVDRDTEKWVRTWQTAGPLLAEIERRELEQMTEDDRQRAIEDVLSVVPLDSKMSITSGLIEQQRWFAKLRQKSDC
jgi:hypothetical protein